MNIQQAYLAGSWYPESEKECRDFLESCMEKDMRSSVAVVSPHAGWFFSGFLSCKSISSLVSDADLVVVCGGHVRAGDPFLFWETDQVATPVGVMSLDGEFQDALIDRFKGRPDRTMDNTIEIQLPMVKYFFPKAMLGACRVPSDSRAADAGRFIHDYAQNTGKKIVVIGSTDLTHYGPNYGFEPESDLQQALRWTKEVNDKQFLDAITRMDFNSALSLAEDNSCACSAGAAVCAAAFAQALGKKNGLVAGYATSYERQKSTSFVGYASVLF